MTAPFECEVRVHVDDIDAFHRRLADLDGRVREAYAFTDHYFQARAGAWDPRQRTLRIREHHEPPAGSEVLLTRIDITHADGMVFKRSQFAEGKVRLYAGTLANCRMVVDGLGFAPWIVVRKRDGRLFEIPGFGALVTEHVEGIGWMIEIEVEGAEAHAAAQAIRAKLEILGIPPQMVTSDPVAALVAATARVPLRTIYFSGSIRGGRTLQPLYAAVVARLQQWGYDVLTTHVAAADVLRQEWREGVQASDIYARDLRWLADCDLVIADVSVPSLGVGVEIAEAQHLGKPVWCLCREDVELSAMVAGNRALRIIRYTHEADLLDRLERELTPSAVGGG